MDDFNIREARKESGDMIKQCAVVELHLQPPSAQL